MDEKRKYPRKECNISVVFEFFEGNPDELNINEAIPLKGKGFMMDISSGGAFLVSNSRVSINMPVRLNFTSVKTKYCIPGTIIRTGIINNNPSEVARRWVDKKLKGDTYIAIKFDTPIDDIPL